MFTTIVVGTDGSDRASQAVERALMLASAYDATLHVVHAYKGTREQVEDTARAVADQLAEMLGTRGVEVRTHAMQGDPADVILDFAYDAGADLIVIGNRGMTGRRGHFSSIPNSISHDASCSVLIVPTAEEPEP
ncbi:MAG TPA: universal stress protein [Acidimicrobiia bacterium]|jgi:nucleotide-binding universal stress UspA family protein